MASVKETLCLLCVRVVVQFPAKYCKRCEAKADKPGTLPLFSEAGDVDDDRF